MNIIDELKNHNVNVNEAIERFMGNRALYEQMLKKFPDAVSTHPVLEHIDSGNYDTAVANAHTLKGVSGNLSLTDIYRAYTEIVQLLRDGKPEQARIKLVDIIPAQTDIIECINAGAN